MTKTIYGFLLVGLLAALVGCSKSDDASASSGDENTAPVTASLATKASYAGAKAKNDSPQVFQEQMEERTASTPSSEVPESERQTIRKASLSVRVPNVEKGEKAANEIIRSAQGYVDKASSTDLAGEHPTMDITARIPAAAFEETLDRFEALGIPVSKTVSSDDVTGSLVALDAQMRSLATKEASDVQMLRRSKNYDGHSEIRDDLQDVKAKMQSTDEQRKSLGFSATLSVIELNLSQTASAVPAPQDRNWLAESWGQAATAMTGAVRIFATLGIWTALFSPFWIPVVLLGRWIYRQRPVARQS